MTKPTLEQLHDKLQQIRCSEYCASRASEALALLEELLASGEAKLSPPTRMTRLSQPTAEPSDTEMLDWCEWVQAKYPRLANDGMTPLTREDIRAAMREQTECAIRAAMRKVSA